MPTNRKREKLAARGRSLTREQARYKKAAVIPRSLLALSKIANSYEGVFSAHLGMLMFRRREQIEEAMHHLPASAWRALSEVPNADALLSLCRARWPEDQILPRDGKWGSQLRWSLDQYVEVHRLIRANSLYGALVTARLFLERWTINAAGAHGIDRADGETDSQFISRVWMGLAPHVTRDVGADWAWMSEAIHGRDPFPEVMDSFFLSGSELSASPHLEKLYERIIEVVEAVSVQLSASIEHQARLRKVDKWHRLLPREQKHLAQSPLHLGDEELQLLAAATLPLDSDMVLSSDAEEIIAFGKSYRETIERPGAQTVVARVVLPYHLVGAVLERRARSIQLARDGFINELNIVDSEDARVNLFARLYRYGAIVEATFLVAGESSTYEKASLCAAASALQSAWQLWLDDTDVTLGCLRGLLEQTSRARTHRLKPARAAKLEQRSASPHRWVEASGLGRLNPIGRALGEFSHLTLRTSRTDARELLIDVQPEGEPYPQHTARGNALDSCAYLLAREVADRLDLAHPRLGAEFRKSVLLLDEDSHSLMENDLLERSLRQRGRVWRGPDFGN